MEKLIIVKWDTEAAGFCSYGITMRVIMSSHNRFVAGSRFDFGFFSIATDEGFTIISIPMNKGQ